MGLVWLPQYPMILIFLEILVLYSLDGNYDLETQKYSFF